MKATSRGAPRLPWRSPPVSAPVLYIPSRRARVGFGTVVALAVFMPIWLPRPLMVGEFSFAFAVPFLLALWALTQPASPGSVRRALQGGNDRGLWLEALCACVIMLLAFMSMLVSPDPLRAFRVILPMAYALCALIVLSRVPPLLQRRMVYSMLFAGALALGLALLMSQTDSGRSIVMRDYRLSGFFENSNQLGVMLLAVFPLAIALLLNARMARLRLICAATVLVLVSAIVLSGTKTALALGFVAGSLTWLYHGFRSGSLGTTLCKLVVTLCAIVLTVPVILWALSWASPVAFRRVNSILTNGVWAYTSMQTRESIWEESIRIGLANPLLGEGAGTRVFSKAHSHNIFADYFRGMGVFGLVAALILVLSAVGRGANFLLSTLHKGTKDRPTDTIGAGMYLGAIFYLIGNQLSDSFSPTTAYVFWMMYVGAYLTTLTPTAAARPDRHPSTLGWRARAKNAPERHRECSPI